MNAENLTITSINIIIIIDIVLNPPTLVYCQTLVTTPYNGQRLRSEQSNNKVQIYYVDAYQYH